MAKDIIYATKKIQLNFGEKGKEDIAITPFKYNAFEKELNEIGYIITGMTGSILIDGGFLHITYGVQEIDNSNKQDVSTKKRINPKLITKEITR